MATPRSMYLKYLIKPGPSRQFKKKTVPTSAKKLHSFSQTHLIRQNASLFSQVKLPQPCHTMSLVGAKAFNEIAPEL